jgi:hypothetical protein
MGSNIETKPKEMRRKERSAEKRLRRQQRREEKRNRDKTPCIESSAIPQCAGPTK